MRETIAASPVLAEVLDAIGSGVFSPGERDRFTPIVGAVTHHDWFMVAADFDAYYAAQRAVDDLWRDPRRWWRQGVLNTARMSFFSSDRTIREYAEEIWRVPVG
jgi:starch phosphorylase